MSFAVTSSTRSVSSELDHGGLAGERSLGARKAPIRPPLAPPGLRAARTASTWPNVSAPGRTIRPGSPACRPAGRAAARSVDSRTAPPRSGHTVHPARSPCPLRASSAAVRPDDAARRPATSPWPRRADHPGRDHFDHQPRAARWGHVARSAARDAGVDPSGPRAPCSPGRPCLARGSPPPDSAPPNAPAAAHPRQCASDRPAAPSGLRWCGYPVPPPRPLPRLPLPPRATSR